MSLRLLTNGILKNMVWQQLNSLHVKGKPSNTTLRILFVRGVPPPLYRQTFRQGRSHGLRGPPPPPLRTFFAQKCLKIVFLPKNTCFLVKNITDLGGAPKIHNSFFLSVKGVTHQIRNSFLPKNMCFLGKNIIFRHF